MKKILSFILLGLMCSIGNVWGQSPVGIVDTTVHVGSSSNPGAATKFNKYCDGLYLYRATGDHSYSAGDTDYKGIKIQNSVSGLVFYLSETKNITATFGYNASKDFPSPTVKLMTFSSDKYSDILGGTVNSTTVPLEAGDTVLLSSTNVTFTEKGAKTATFENVPSGYYYIYGITTSSNTYFCKIKFEVVGGGSDPQPSTFTVTYNANGATSGSVPTDANSPYNSGATVTVIGNSGNLAKTGYTFNGWNTKADGTGTTYNMGGTFEITANTTLYAQWTEFISENVVFLWEKKGNTGITADNTDLSNATYGTLKRGASVLGRKFGSNNMDHNAKGYKLGNNDVCIEIEGTSSFAVGDTIIVSGVCGGSGARSFAIGSSSISDASNATLNTNTQENSTDILEYSAIITSTEAGSKIRIFRLAGKTMYLYSIKVIHPIPTEAPAITTDLSSAANVGVDIVETFSIVATGATSYQWYTCDDALKTNPVAIDGATSDSYEYTADVAGTTYLYCVATNEAGSTSSTVCAVTASVIAAHSVTYAWGTMAAELSTVAVPTQADVAEGHDFTVASLPAAIKYNFLGWSDGVNTYAAGASYTMSTSNVALTAQWSELTQTTITAATTWDWANAGSSSHQLGNDTYPSSNSEFVMANLSGIPNDANFNSQALLVTTQFANRGDSHYFQGNVIKFTTNAPGTVQVTYSNTGGSRPYRHIEVNGVLSAEGSASTEAKTTEAIAVAAGEVVIKVYIPDASSPQAREGDVVGYTMARISKIVFTPTQLVATDADFYGLYYEHEVNIPSGITVYTGKLNQAEIELALTQISGTVIPAETPVLVKAAAAGTYDFAPCNTSAPAIANNDLKGVAVATTVASIEAANTGKTCLTLGADGEGVVAFRKPAGSSIAANKVYLLVTTPTTSAPSIRIVEAGNGATDIKSIEDSEKAVKFIENGKLYIQKDGVVYDATGAKVK